MPPALALGFLVFVYEDFALPFRCVSTLDIPDEVSVEKLLHRALAEHRTRLNREFFEIDPQRVVAAMKLTGG